MMFANQSSSLKFQLNADLFTMSIMLYNFHLYIKFKIDNQVNVKIIIIVDQKLTYIKRKI